jgi:hypothetical protein
MLAFDAESYLKTVLAPVARGAPAPDVFARYLLEPGDEDEDAIKQRMVAVKAHWDKLESRNNAKYATLLGQLIHEHTRAELTLLSAADRRSAAEQIRAREAQATQRRREDQDKFEQQVRESVARDGGLTVRSRRILEEFSHGLMLEPATVAARLDSCPAVAEPSEIEPLPASVRNGIREALAAYANAIGTPSLALSLFHAIGLPGTEHDPAVLRSTWQQQSQIHKSLNVQSAAKIPMGKVLGFAKVHLIDEDPDAYIATLIAEVREALRPAAAGAALEDNAIDELESERLVREAQERGLGSQDARDLVSRLAMGLGVELRLGAAVDYISCAKCNRPHPLAGAPEHCTRCGSSLFTNCPKCQARHPASDAACSHCGADLAAYARSLQLMSDAELALQSGRIALAHALASDARDEAGESNGKLLAKIDSALRAARSQWEAIEREISERRLFAAISHLARLEQTASDVSSPSGQTVSERRAAVAERLRVVEALLVSARAQEAHEREQSFARALEQATDCREAEQELARIEPLPPTDVQASIDGNAVTVHWQASRSPGPRRYQVRRMVGQSAAGVEVGTTTSLHSNDPAPPTGQNVRYCVLTERAGRTSRLACSQPLFVLRDIESLAVIERDGEVQLTWRPVDANAQVEVKRTDEHGDVTQLRGERDGLLDRDVRPEGSYRYRIRATYATAREQSIHTAGRVVFAKPARRPEPICDLAAEADGAKVRLRCAPLGSGQAIVLRCARQPEEPEGAELTQQDMSGIGERLQQDSEGIYDSSPAACTWYLPISQSGAYLIAGRAIRHLALTPITDVRATDHGSSVRLTWAWPTDTRAAIVAWRRDRQPSDAEDQRAKRIAITQAQYVDRGGVDLDAPGSQPVFIAVFAATRIDEELLGTSSCDRRARLLVSRSTRNEVRYAVRRLGLRRRKVRVEVLAPQDSLPGLLLVVKDGELLPRSAADGRVIANLGGEGGKLDCELDLNELGRPIAIRMFASPAAADRTLLHDPDARDLVLR